MTRELFHFICEEHGLCDIRERRLKISQIQDLNDPLELLPVELSNPEHRPVLRRFKEQFSSNRGMPCFSETWSNPVLWSHYADKHRGLCLGFDVNCDVRPVSYTLERLPAELLTTTPLNEKVVEQLLRTKFAHWEYEQEVRCFPALNERDPKTNLYFADFSDKLKLTKVIVGARSRLPHEKLADVLRDSGSKAKVIMARLAFKEFKVVPNLRRSRYS